MVVFSSQDRTVGAMKDEVEMKADLGEELPAWRWTVEDSRN